MRPLTTPNSSRLVPTLPRLLVAGVAAGSLEGLLMLIVMGVVRLFLGVATPTEMIFDRLFPKLTVTFFIDQLVAAGGYTPLKLRGVFGALAGHLAVAAFGGVVYAWSVSRVDRRGGRLVLPGVVAATLLFTVLLWPNLLTHYRGLPPGLATANSILGMLVSFGVCGLALMAFFRLLYPIALEPTLAPSSGRRAGVDPGRRAFLATGLGAGLAVALGAMLRRLYVVGTFSYDGRQYSGPEVQRITPISPEDEFYQVSKNLVDPRIARSGWRLSIVGEVENPQTYRFADLAALPAVEQQTTRLTRIELIAEPDPCLKKTHGCGFYKE